MNNYVIGSYTPSESYLPKDVRFVYRKCFKCGQIIGQLEFEGAAFVADSCPKCGIPFVSEKEHLDHLRTKAAFARILDENRLNINYKEENK